MKIETRQLEGRSHYVVPVVMICEGTWSGSNGPVYYPSDVLNASVKLWDGKPIVVYHPDMYGNSFAGCPDVFNRQKVGVIFNTRYVNRKLKAEAWLDSVRVEAVDNRILVSIQKRSPVEVSTGVIVNSTGDRLADGAIVAANLVPDHLAILPDKKGACSRVDGAGLLVNAKVDMVGTLDLPVMNF